MPPLFIAEGDEEGALPGVLRFLEILPLELELELVAPDLLDLAADVREVDVRPAPREIEVEVVPR